MAKLSKILNAEKKQKNVETALSKGKKAKHGVRAYNRCKLCGRVGGYMRKFQMCRICFRERANQGLLMGIKKSSW